MVERLSTVIHRLTTRESRQRESYREARWQAYIVTGVHAAEIFATRRQRVAGAVGEPAAARG